MDPAQKHWSNNSLFSKLQEEYKRYIDLSGLLPLEIAPRRVQQIVARKLYKSYAEDLVLVMTRKARLYKLEEALFPAERIAAQLACLLQLALKCLPLWAAAPLARHAFGGWPCSARFGCHGKPCHLCGMPDGDSIEHLASCPIVEGWSGLVFGGRAPLVVPPSLPGLLGWSVPPIPDDQTRYILFVLGLWETWTAAKHGSLSRPSPAQCRQRLRHCAIRDIRIAKLEELIGG